ncbi:DUF421 domain-containing protein [Apilactobacillus kunkeei]|uniref:DUF421 domain-containing protein n=1 Tax=Apilactobacillus kunkeei TaxID=148814 RepID=UPI0021A9DC35|nr:YetF domain-containing protein [Apilactobacillus kunkeei]
MATAIIKLTGKTTLAPQAPIDQIQNYILGGIIGGSIYSSDITILNFVTVMIIWGVVSISFYYIRRRYPKISEMLDGKEIRIIENGSFLNSALDEAQLSISELYSMIRSQAYGSVTEIEIGTIEKNGSLSIIPKSTADKSFVVVIDGQLKEDELSRGNIIDSDVLSIIKSKGFESIDDVGLLELSSDKKINVIQKMI